MPKTLSRVTGQTRYRRHSDRPAATDAQAIGKLCDEHSAALFFLAVTLTHDRQRAEEVVVNVICRTATSSPGGRSADDVRRELARHVYLTCAETTPCPVITESPAPGAAGQQRAALALVQYGKFSYHETAELLQLPSDAVAQLLRVGLVGHANTTK